MTTPDRSLRSQSVRSCATQLGAARRPAQARSNGDEDHLPNYIGNFIKGLPQDQNGEVQPAAYQQLVAALERGASADFERLPLGTPGGRRLTNPQAGLAFDLQGADAQALDIPPAPSFTSAEIAAEMAELYWMALLRDVAFIDYDQGGGTAALVSEATQSLTGYGQLGAVTPQTLFRGISAGDRVGPYLSQFLLMGSPGALAGADSDATLTDGYISYGTLRVDQRQRTVARGVDYLTRYSSASDQPNFRAVQEGRVSFAGVSDVTAVAANRIEAPRLFIRNLRDLAHWVHFDALYEAYLNACLLLLSLGAPLSPGNPYVNSRTQVGFGTFGGPHILSLVTEVATRALKCVWWQKWGVHRRLRPEEFGGRVHQQVSGARGYPIHDALLQDQALLDRVFNHNLAQNGDEGSYLLPQAFPEGCPTHPAYGAGHATVAGACVTILKAWFDETHVLTTRPLAAHRDGDRLVIAANNTPVTVGGELDKLAANIALGRSGAGVHWRSDYTESVRLGEELAISILREQRATYSEDAAFCFTRFDGARVSI